MRRAFGMHRHALRWASRALLALAPALALPAAAGPRAWVGPGIVLDGRGMRDLIPFPLIGPGQLVELEFAYDDAVADINPSPTIGLYPLESISITREETTVVYVDGGSGEGRIRILADPVGVQSWSIVACRGDCEPGDYDEVSIELVYQGHPLASDALVDPPSPFGPTLLESNTFALFSEDSIIERDALVEGLMGPLTYVPEPSGALLLATGALVLTGARARRGR